MFYFRLRVQSSDMGITCTFWRATWYTSHVAPVHTPPWIENEQDVPRSTWQITTIDTTGTTYLSEHCFTGTSLQMVLVCFLAHSADLSLLVSPPEVSFKVDLFHLGLDLLGASEGTSKHSSTSSSQQLCITLHSSACSLKQVSAKDVSQTSEYTVSQCSEGWSWHTLWGKSKLLRC